MDTSFLMHRNPIGAGFCECGDEFVGLFDHQVTIEGDPGDLAKRGDHGRADRKIRNEMAVHDVQVENGGSALDGRQCLFAKTREVSGKDGRGDFYHVAIQLAAFARSVSARPIFWIMRAPILSPRSKPTGRRSFLLCTTGIQEMP
jgi:hypothetical protein